MAECNLHHLTGRDRHPVMVVSPGRRRRAPLLMGMSLLADVSAVFLLLGAPSLGAILAGALFVTYTWVAMPVHLDGRPADCRCFFKLLNTRTSTGLLVRNLWLLLLAVVILLGRPIASWAGLGVGLALLAATSLLVAAIDRISGAAMRRSHDDRAPPGNSIVTSFGGSPKKGGGAS